MPLYVNEHRSQLAKGNSAITRSSGCTWTAAANGADAATHGKKGRTPDQVHSLVKRSEETSPATPGWSIPDVVLAMKRLGVPFANRSGRGWDGVEAALGAGLYVVVQGDSDRFTDATCSGAFDGDHCIGIHPKTRIRNARRQRWIDDGICPKGRWEYESVLRQYAEKLDERIRYGVFTTPVPKAKGLVLKPGATAITPPKGKRIKTATATVHRRPDPDSKLLNRRKRGGRFVAWQEKRGWYGNRGGRRWIAKRAFGE